MLCFSFEARVSSVLKDGNWVSLSARFEDLVCIQSNLSLLDIGEEDKPIWIVGNSGQFSCVEA